MTETTGQQTQPTTTPANDPFKDLEGSEIRIAYQELQKTIAKQVRKSGLDQVAMAKLVVLDILDRAAKAKGH